ncbi:MAG TPA: hypothetical protein VE990_06015 [Acidimicrobiales bacterium]|nr:hypothetical protein [Acidimicrobiales bacterium]
MPSDVAGAFGETVERYHRQRLRLPVETALGVECTRATYLSFDPADQATFADELRDLFGPGPDLEVTQETSLAMAPVKPG